MKKETPNVKCPKCSTVIDVNSILYQQLQKEAERKYEQQLSKIQSEFDAKQAEIIKEKEEILKMKSELDVSIAKGVNQRLLQERAKMENFIRYQLNEEKADELNLYKKQLEEKMQEVKELNRLRAEFQILQREKSDLKEKVEAEAEQKINEKLAEEKLRIRKEAEDKNQMKLAEKDYLIKQLKDQLTESQRKIDQGSMQVQGEVQELAIDEYLKTQFPLDTIVEIKKGARGADSLHQINTRTKQNHGTIYYESKRTKDFQPSWIEKFKTDLREKGAMFGVIVTDAYPKGMDRMGQIDNVWVCSFEEFKGLCFVLRETVILLDSAILSQENKGSKMEMLYEFLTGNEFRMQIEAIVEGFSQMQNDLTKEKRAMDSIWKQREKQIQKVILNTVNMYASVKGIAGSAIKSIKQLELGPHENK